MPAGDELLQCSGGSMLWMLSLTAVVVESHKYTIAMDSCCTYLQRGPFSGTKGNMFKALEPFVVVVYSKQLYLLSKMNYITEPLGHWARLGGNN